MVVLSYEKKVKGCVFMALRHITVGKAKANRVWLTLLVITFIPCILLGIYYAVFVVPNQTFSAEQQEVVDAIVASTSEHGGKLGEVTLNLSGFTGEIVIRNGVVSLPQASIPSRIVNSLLNILCFCVLDAIAIAILYGISGIFIRYED